MNKRTPGPATLLLCCLGCLLLPGLAAWLFYGQPVPFLLKGPHFLTIYMIHMAGCYSLLLLLRQKTLRINTLCAWFLALAWIWTPARILQGMAHHKPAGFLVLLLLLHTFILLVALRTAYKKSRP